MSLLLLLASILTTSPLLLLPSYVSMGNSFPKPLTAKEEEDYLRLFEEGSKEAKDVLVERNLRLVAHIAKKYANTGKNPDDLISIGTIGLIKSVNTYNRNKSVRLATYAAKCLENEILMNIRTTRKTKVEISLNDPIGIDKDGNEISFNDVLGTDADAIVDDIDRKIQISRLYESIQTKLNRREKCVIILRFGLSGDQCRTQREVANSLGISRSYVSRIEKKAISKLKETFQDDGME